MADEPSFPGAPKRPWTPPPRSQGRPYEARSADDESSFELGGPAAPSIAPSGQAHPVVQKLLAKAERAERERTAGERPTGSESGRVPPEVGVVQLAGLQVLSHHLDDGSSARLVGREGTPAPSSPLPSSAALLGLGPGAPDGQPSRSAPAPSDSSGDADATEFRRPHSLTPPPQAVRDELAELAGLPAAASEGSRPERKAWLSPTSAAALAAALGAAVVVGVTSLVDLKPWSPGAAPAPTPGALKMPVPAPVLPKRQKIAGPWRIEGNAGAGERIIRGKVGKEPFLKALEAAGVPKSEAYRAFGALRGLVDLEHCSSSDQFLALVKNPERRLLAFEYIAGHEDVYQAKAGPDGRLSGAKLDLHVERQQVRRALVVSDSFTAAAAAAGFDRGLDGVVEKALSGHLSLRELKRGDRMRIVAQEVTVLGEFARYAGVEAIELEHAGGKTERFYYYSHPTQSGYFDSAGRAPWEGGFRKPIPGAPVTSKFNMKRMHPVLKKIMPHTGTDFGAPAGTPIGATKAGKITFMGWGGPSGNLVKVAHDGGYESGYAHLIRFAENLKVGDSVTRLQTVGYCGSTGRSTGPHLHFTMRRNGEYVDPESLNLDGKRVLPAGEREAFAQVRAKYDPILDQIPWPAPLAPEAPAAPIAPPGPADAGEMDEEGGEEPAPRASAQPTPAAPAVAKPAALPAPALSPAAAVAPPSGKSIFLSDGDLLKMQAPSDPGEVEE